MLLRRIKTWASIIKRDGMTLYFALRHPLVPWYAKAVAVFAVIYALSPIDLIPDFIPVLGLLDELIILPVLLWIAMRMIPAGPAQECRASADAWVKEKKGKVRSTAGAVFVVLCWLVGAWLLWRWLSPYWTTAGLFVLDR